MVDFAFESVKWGRENLPPKEKEIRKWRHQFMMRKSIEKG